MAPRKSRTTNRPDLTVVTDETPPEPPAAAPVLTIVQAAETGDRLEELRAMRRRIAQTLDNPNTPARDLAALSRRQIEIGKEVEAIEIARGTEASVVASTDDEIWDGTGY